MDPLSILIITYTRTETALRTIRALGRNLEYPPERLYFHIADDGSPGTHVKQLMDAIHEFCPNKITLSNSQRQGVGVSMNLGQRACFERADYILWLEDDWELVHPFNPTSCMELLRDDHTLGMIRLGYVSPGIQGEIISGANRLWWRLKKGPTYTFSGHASIRHRRFYDAYGRYQTTLAPGATELYMCGTFNNTAGPDVVVPVYNEYGIFAHIGTVSLKDEQPS